VLIESVRLERWLADASADATLREEARAWSALICLRSGAEEVRLSFKDGVLGKGAGDSTPAAIILEGDPAAWAEVFGGLSLNRAVRELKIGVKGNVREAMKNWRTLWLLFELAHQGGE